jgi:SMI1 / KNR4 family (SUKH-1)
MEQTPEQHFFAADELSALAEHGIVFFADRVIFDAQPPMTAQQISEVECFCNGALPNELVSLWKCTAGGRLDYDLTLPMGDHQMEVSWLELFYTGSDGYRDLQGWIDHEIECAEEAAQDAQRAWSGKINYLPIGGFEYCDRIYVCVDPAEYGEVIAWQKGLPPAWKYRLHEDGVTTVAKDLISAFKALHLTHDPLNAANGSRTALLEYLAVRCQNHGLPESLEQKVIAFYRQSLVDWHTPLMDGSLQPHSPLARMALRQVLEDNQSPLLEKLIPLVGINDALQAAAPPLILALNAGSFECVEVLLKCGAAVPEDAMEFIRKGMPTTLTLGLLKGGSRPVASAVALCVADGEYDSANAILAAAPTLFSTYPHARDKLLKETQQALSQDLKHGSGGNVSGATLKQRIERLGAFRASQ